MWFKQNIDKICIDTKDQWAYIGEDWSVSSENVRGMWWYRLDHITAIIGPKMYKLSIKIEAKILEPLDIRPSKESWERAEANLDDLAEVTQVTMGKQSETQPQGQS